MSDKHEERWKAHKYKLGDDGFKVLNEWAKDLLAWEERLWAMCAIMEVELGVSEEAFEGVLSAIRRGQHTPGKIKDILEKAKSGKGALTAGVGLATDVVGHPPDPPFA